MKMDMNEMYSGYPNGPQSHVGANYPYYQPPTWLTSVGQHEQQRICRGYYKHGCPDEVAESMSFAYKWGLTPPHYLSETSKTYGITPSENNLPMHWYGAWQEPGVSRLALLAVGALALIVVYIIVSSKRTKVFESPSDATPPNNLSKNLISPVTKLIKAKSCGCESDIAEADEMVYDMIHKHGIKIKRGAIPFAFTKQEKKYPELLAKRISCAAQVLDDDSDEGRAHGICRGAVKAH